MGVLKPVLVAVVAVFVYTRVIQYKGDNLPVNFGGTCDEDFQGVVDVFRRNVESGKEPGGAFAVYYQGRPVIDVWGGYADPQSYRPWEENTTTVVFSCSKGMAAILMAKMVEEGLLDYSRLVSDYWPEFGQNGKENVTVEMLISHQAGVPFLDTPLSLRECKINKEKCTAFGYHALTFGLYVDELIERADPQHRDTATLFRELIGEPFGVDFGMNTPRAEFHRTARLQTRSKAQLLMDALTYRRYLTPMSQIVFTPDSMMAKSVAPIVEYAQSTETLNDPAVREVTVSSCSGTGTARGLAKMYGILTNGGTEDGKTILSPNMMKSLATPLLVGKDVVMLTGEQSQLGRGTLYRKNPKGQRCVGHTGFGGQVAIGDLENGLGLSYLTNHLSINGVGDDPRFRDVEEALYETIDRIQKNS
ncbi:LACT2-like protein [Mya arenaria]|uniref:LACT2-like protein n=1 Tax=Mya arenaria TaxID=6604 RepID=A0ABY7GD40_MYAAR|nr:LACT2-like protein [Mya arenaria]